VLDYWKGSPEQQGRAAIKGRYRMNFLRFALLVIDRARVIGGKPREAREQAAKEIAREVITWACDQARTLGEQIDYGEESARSGTRPFEADGEKARGGDPGFQTLCPIPGDDPQKVESAFAAIRTEVINKSCPTKMIPFLVEQSQPRLNASAHCECLPGSSDRPDRRRD
jgi:hypothetical protein